MWFPVACMAGREERAGARNSPACARFYFTIAALSCRARSTASRTCRNSVLTQICSMRSGAAYLRVSFASERDRRAIQGKGEKEQLLTALNLQGHGRPRRQGFQRATKPLERAADQ